MTFTIFFATSTGKTEDVADRLKELLPGAEAKDVDNLGSCLLYTSPSPRDATLSRMPSSA